MYLTCVSMNRLHPSTRQALGDCCDMHRNVMRLFASVEENPLNGTVLYRVLEEAGKLHLYLSSAAPPDFSKAAWLDWGQDARRRSLAPVIDSMEAGKTFFFDLLTYPCKKTDVGRKNSVRVFLQTQEERRAWLMRQGEKNGFSVTAYHEEMPQDIRGKRSTGLVQIRAIRMSGVLRITDADAFRKCYTGGIGPEKAYGLGMLMLRKG